LQRRADNNMGTPKYIKVGGVRCLIQTLSEWLQSRIEQTKKDIAMSEFVEERANMTGRYWELQIIWEKINDGRIQEIGKTKFRREKS
jgi:hypothetical protein